jgi:hypothetical protein
VLADLLPEDRRISYHLGRSYLIVTTIISGVITLSL